MKVVRLICFWTVFFLTMASLSFQNMTYFLSFLLTPPPFFSLFSLPLTPFLFDPIFFFHKEIFFFFKLIPFFLVFSFMKIKLLSPRFLVTNCMSFRATKIYYFYQWFTTLCGDANRRKKQWREISPKKRQNAENRFGKFYKKKKKKKQNSKWIRRRGKKKHKQNKFPNEFQ